MSRFPAVAACCLLLAAPGSSGAESGAPLESSKQGLRKLQGDSKTGQGPDVREGVKTSMPVLQIPGQEDSAGSLLLNPEKLEKQRKTESEREERRNWLVNGVKRLEASEGRKDGEHARSEPVPVSTTPEAPKAVLDDPQYLLRMYEEQKRTESSRQTEAKPARQAAADPLAPFLQGWLGNSPVRGPSFDEFARKGGADTSHASSGTDHTAATIPTGTPAPGSALTTASAPATPAPNPYLAAPDLPRTGSVPLLPSLTQPPVLQPATNPATPPMLPPGYTPSVQPEARPPDRKPATPPQTEDKKYFPQLNKF